MKYPLILLSLFTTSCALVHKLSGPPLKVIHYNIKEFDSTKIQGQHSQKDAVIELLKGEDFNIVSLNEVQFDRPQVPTQKYQSYGQNIAHFLNDLREGENWHTSFEEANTGAKAKKWKDRYMLPGQTGARKYADPYNFGLFPGQYSTGLGVKFKIVGKVVVKKLLWKEFIPQRNVRNYRDGRGRKLPNSIELFDKSFTDTMIMVKGRLIHLITLHTVPAYHFGNKASPNYQRNADQLRFLEWYLTGKTDIKVKLPKKYQHIEPLAPGSTYIAMGDWNTEVQNLKNPGSRVLRRLNKTGRLFPSLREIKKDHDKYITNEGTGHNPKRLKMTLDYIYYSKDLRPHELKVVRPAEERLFLGCGSDILKTESAQDRLQVSYQNGNEQCHMTISPKFHTAKKASDHFPIVAKFDFNQSD